jgi:RNA polymerase sigma-70 factor (ECF subfamily)
MVKTNNNYTEKTDRELVKFTLRDKNSYGYLMQRYEKKLMRYIIRLSGASKDDAEDILQGVFIKAYQKLNDFDINLKFSSWIYRITHNETVSYLRKSDSRPKILSPEKNSIMVNLLKKEPDLEKEIDRKKLAENINKIIYGLKRKYKEVLILKYIEEKDYREISDILKKPPGTVATLLKRGKEKLKAEIMKHKEIF